MTTDSAPRIKITYATLSADNEELHSQFEAGLATTRANLGGHHQNYVGGAWRDGDGSFEVRSPIDNEILLGTFARGTAADIDDAVAAARAAQPGWAAVPWRERVAIVKRAGDLISERLMDYSPSMAVEVGKNRIEALGEVEESADLLRYYAKTMEDNDGYDHEMGNLGDSTVHTRSILRPHGVFAVISPFNFPMALATGPAGRGSPRWQYRRGQALVGVASIGGQPGQGLHRCGCSEGRHQPRDGPRRDGRPDAAGSPRRRWHRLHRLVRGRDAAFPLVLEGMAATDDRRDGWQEPGDRVAQGRSRGGGRGDHAQRLRLRRTEMLGELAGLRRTAGPRRARPAAGREDREGHHRRSARPRQLDGPRHRPESRRPASDRGHRGTA